MTTATKRQIDYINDLSYVLDMNYDTDVQRNILRSTAKTVAIDHERGSVHAGDMLGLDATITGETAKERRLSLDAFADKYVERWYEIRAERTAEARALYARLDELTKDEASRLIDLLSK